MRSLTAVSLLAVAACSSSRTPNSLRLTPAAVTVPAGARAAVQASAVYADGSAEDVTALAAWSTDDASIATVSTGAVSGVAKGASQVHATYAGRSATAAITVSDAALSALAIRPGAASLAAGVQQQLEATGTFTDGSTHDLTGQVVWTSSAPSIATVSAAGLLGAVAPGQATIGATFSGIPSSVHVTVTSAVATAVAVTPGTASLARGSVLPLAATATFSDGSTADVSTQVAWTTSSAAVASTRGRMVTGVSRGAADVTAAFHGKSGSAHLQVASVAGLAVTPASSAIVEGHGARLSAVATLDDGHTQDVTASAAWTSSNANVAVVSMDAATRGLVSAVAPGPSTIGAAFDSAAAAAQVQVARVAVSVATPVLQPGEDGVFTLQAQASSFIPAATPVSWKLTAIRNSPTGPVPDANQALSWFGGAPGEDPADPATWTTGAHTDAAGVALLGATSGVPFGQTGLPSDAGQTLRFRTPFATKGDHSLQFELFDVTDPSAPVSIGASSVSHVNVGTIRILDGAELLLFGASPTADGSGTAAEVFPQAFSVHPDGTGQVQLTPSPEPFQSPRDVVSELTRSPDGKIVAWVDGRDRSPRNPFFSGLIYLADADGSHVRRLSSVDSSACQERSAEFSPDGQWIAFVRVCTPDPGGRASIEFEYISHPDGSGERRILIPDVNDLPPPQPIPPVTYGTFSRDSSTVYVVESPALGNNLWAYRIADGTSRLVVNYSGPDEQAFIVKFPMVLPGGDLLYEYHSLAVDTDLWLERIHPDGTGRQIVRPLDVDPDSLAMRQGLFALSPDGTRVAYETFSDDDQAWVVQVSNVDGSAAQTVSSPTLFIRRISWVR